MTFQATFKASVRILGARPESLTVTVSPAVNDTLFALVQVAAIASPSTSVAATLDDLVAPAGWLRLDADTLQDSGDPSVLTGVVALYVFKATASGSQSFTWSWRVPANGVAYGGTGSQNYAWVHGVRYSGVAGVGGLAADKSARRSPSNAMNYPATTGKAGTGHALRVGALLAGVNGHQYPTTPAGATKRHTDTLNQDTFPLGKPVEIMVADSAVATSLPTVATGTVDGDGAAGTGALLANLGWTVFLSDVVAPTPPTLLSPTDGSWTDLAAGFRLSLQHNTFGQVGALSGIALWRSTDGGTTKTWWKASTGTWEATEQVNTSAVPELTFPSGKWSNAGTAYTVGVATTGDGSSTLSEYTQATLVGSDPPAASLSITGLTAGEVNDVTPTAVVTGTPATAATLTGWQVRVFDMVTAGANLATNASFESGVAGWAGPSGYVAGVCEPSDQHATHGTTSMLVTWPGGGIGAASRLFPVVAGKTYTWSAWIWIAPGSPGVRASWPGTAAGNAEFHKGSDRRVTLTFTATTTGNIPLGVETASGLAGSVYVDRIQLEEGTTATDWVYSEPEAGTPTVDSGVLPGAPGSWTVPIESALTPHQAYQVHAKVQQSGGQWSPWVTLNVTPNVDTPTAPTLTVAQTAHPTSGAPALTVTATMPAWTGMPMTARVQRLAGEVWVEAGSNDFLVADAATDLVDYAAPSDVDVFYRVRAETTDLDGAPLIGPWSTAAVGHLSNVGGWLIDPTHPETAVNVVVVADDTRNTDTQAEAVTPLASGVTPVAQTVVATSAVLPSGATTVRVSNQAQQDAVRSLLTSGGLLLLRWWLSRDRAGHLEATPDLWFRVVGAVQSSPVYQGPTSVRHVQFSWVGQYPRTA